MKQWARFLSVSLLCSVVGLAATDGTRPRSTVNKYPVSIQKDPVFRPQQPGMIAAGLQRKASSTKRTGVVSSGTIGYESRRERYPETYPGRRGRSDDIRTGGPRTTIGVGVLRDRRPRPSTDRDRQVMKTELEDKGLPQGFTGSPVAGYLYFEVGKFRKKAEHRLEYRGNGEGAVLVLPGK